MPAQVQGIRPKGVQHNREKTWEYREDGLYTTRKGMQDALDMQKRREVRSFGISEKKDLSDDKSGSWHAYVFNRLSHGSITCIRSKGRAMPFSALRLP